jgi:hypothetical protein
VAGTGDSEGSAEEASIMLLLLGKHYYYQARSVGTLGAEMVEGACLMVRLSITPTR